MLSLLVLLFYNQDIALFIFLWTLPYQNLMPRKAIMHKPQKVLSFLWSVIKPYKWWYLLMLQASFGPYSAFYFLFYEEKIATLHTGLH